MTDILDYICAPREFSRSYHMASAIPGVNPVYTLDVPGAAQLIKAFAGFPFDYDPYDDNYVYQSITEGPNGWTDSSSVKQFVQPIIWAPRDLDSYQGQLLVTADSTYNTYQGGKIIATQSLGPVSVQVEQPQIMDVGALKGVSVVRQHYYWGATMEVNLYAKGYSLVQWQRWVQLTAGAQYTPVGDNVYDQVTAGGTPALVPPQGVTL